MEIGIKGLSVIIKNMVLELIFTKKNKQKSMEILKKIYWKVKEKLIITMETYSEDVLKTVKKMVMENIITKMDQSTKVNG